MMVYLLTAWKIIPVNITCARFSEDRSWLARCIGKISNEVVRLINIHREFIGNWY